MDRPDILSVRNTRDRWTKITALAARIHSTSYTDVIDYGLEAALDIGPEATKPEMHELSGERLDRVADLSARELDLLEDAIRIRRHQLMARRLQAAGFDTRLSLDEDGPWFSYVLIYPPNGSLPNEWATLEEAQRLLDTARNLPPQAAYERWRAKVRQVERHPYTQADARADIRAERAELRQLLAEGKIDAEMHAEFHRDARDYLDYVEED